jgi:hypothetical protein
MKTAEAMAIKASKASRTILAIIETSSASAAWRCSPQSFAPRHQRKIQKD